MKQLYPVLCVLCLFGTALVNLQGQGLVDPFADIFVDTTYEEGEYNFTVTRDGESIAFGTLYTYESFYLDFLEMCQMATTFDQVVMLAAITCNAGVVVDPHNMVKVDINEFRALQSSEINTPMWWEFEVETKAGQMKSYRVDLATGCRCDMDEAYWSVYYAEPGKEMDALRVFYKDIYETTKK